MTTAYPEVAEKLRLLHAHDARIHEFDEQLRREPARLDSLQQRVRDVEKKIAAVDERAKVLKAQIKLRENELRAAEQKIERVQAQSAEVKTNKEFVAFKAELTNFQADADRLQGEILKILDVVEQATKRLDALVGEKAQAQKRVEDAKARLEESLEEVKRDRDRLLEERGALLAGIPPQTLEIYERARRGRGRGLAILEGEYCGACMEHLTRNDVFAVQNLNRLVQCGGCNRIVLPG